MDLRERRILITGGASGIGLALARLLVADNRVVVASRDPAKLERAVAGVAGLGAAPLDVTSEPGARAALAGVVERLGGLDLLVNSAGVAVPVPLEHEAAGRAIDEEVAVNLVGALRLTRLALPHLRQADDGAVVFLSSALALAAAPGLVSYAATKAAVHSLARSLRAELAGQVKVFDVLPPFVDTALAAGLGRTRQAPSAVAAAILYGLRRDRYEIRIGRVNALALLGRLWPAAADRLVARELGRGSAAGAPAGRPATSGRLPVGGGAASRPTGPAGGPKAAGGGPS
jgi:uncharacterized oxidoreductase